MRKKCESCGRPIEAKRSARKYCDDTCRKRAQRKPGGVKDAEVLALPSESTSDSAGDLTAATLVELEAAARAGSALGVQALALARRIDGSAGDTGSAVASLSKELREVMKAALADAPKAADPLDELRARRESKRNTG